MKEISQSIQSPKGSIASVVHYSENDSGKLAVLCPGFLDTKDYAHLVGLARELSTKGFTVVRFDPIGTWDSEGDISDYTNSQYLEDIQHVLEYMLGQAEYQTILLGGHSRGGQMSILYAARDPQVDLVLGIMSSSKPITGRKREEWKKNGIHTSSRDLPGNSSKRKEFRVPFTHVLDRDQYDAVDDVKNIKVPIVLIAGGSDELVPPEDVKEIFRNANKPKRFLILEDTSHDYRLNSGEVQAVNEKILEQLGQFV